MKIIFNSEGVAQGTALDAYEGPDAWGVAPEGFDPARLSDYTLLDGEVVFIPSSRITKLAFRNRFNQGEKVTLELASIHNPAAAPANQQAAAALRVYLADVAAATWVDLLRADTRAGVQALATYGILTQARVDAILDSPILPEERPM
jgi:hypothetical protein